MTETRADEIGVPISPEVTRPYLAEMAVTQAAKSGYDEESDFEFGMKLILDGLQRVLDAP